jgi:hypothetical protein
MRVRDDRAFDGPPRIDEEVAGRAIEALGALDDEIFHGGTTRETDQYRLPVTSSAMRISA